MKYFKKMWVSDKVIVALNAHKKKYLKYETDIPYHFILRLLIDD